MLRVHTKPQISYGALCNYGKICCYKVVHIRRSLEDIKNELSPVIFNVHILAVERSA